MFERLVMCDGLPNLRLGDSRLSGKSGTLNPNNVPLAVGDAHLES